MIKYSSRVVGPGSDPALTSSQVFRKPATPSGSPITIFLISPHRSITKEGPTFLITATLKDSAHDRGHGYSNSLITSAEGYNITHTIRS